MGNKISRIWVVLNDGIDRQHCTKRAVRRTQCVGALADFVVTLKPNKGVRSYFSFIVQNRIHAKHCDLVRRAEYTDYQKNGGKHWHQYLLSCAEAPFAPPLIDQHSRPKKQDQLRRKETPPSKVIGGDRRRADKTPDQKADCDQQPSGFFVAAYREYAPPYLSNSLHAHHEEESKFQKIAHGQEYQ